METRNGHDGPLPSGDFPRHARLLLKVPVGFPNGLFCVFLFTWSLKTCHYAQISLKMKS